MFEEPIIQSRGFQNVGEPGARSGFQLCIRTPYYRGMWLSMLEGADVTVDGARHSRTEVGWTIAGATYSVEELAAANERRWPYEENRTADGSPRRWPGARRSSARGGGDLPDVVHPCGDAADNVDRASQPDAGGGMSEQMRLGVALYSYGADFMTTMTLEDCLADVADMGATGVEILSDTHIVGYPQGAPPEWRRGWHGLLERYGLEATCYSCWIDSRLIPGRTLTVGESLALFRRDLELAAELGFTIVRPRKLGVVTWDLVPDPAWRETMERALPDAARLGIKIAPEIHWPTPIQSEVVDAYLDLIKATGTDHFGFVIDTGVFQDREREHRPGLTEDRLGGDIDLGEAPPRPPELMGVAAEDMLPIMDHVVHIHAKFWEMTDDLQDPHIPWEPIIRVLRDSGYRGYLSSEYEGEQRLYLASDVLRRQQLMLRRLLSAG